MNDSTVRNSSVSLDIGSTQHLGNLESPAMVDSADASNDARRDGNDLASVFRGIKLFFKKYVKDHGLPHTVILLFVFALIMWYPPQDNVDGSMNDNTVRNVSTDAASTDDLESLVTIDLENFWTNDSRGWKSFGRVSVGIALLLTKYVGDHLEYHDCLQKLSMFCAVTYICFYFYVARQSKSIVITNKDVIRQIVDGVLSGSYRSDAKDRALIFFWKFTKLRGKNVGHAALQLLNVGMKYFSFWPGAQLAQFPGDIRKKLKVLAATNTLSKDMIAEGDEDNPKYPDKVIVIPAACFDDLQFERVVAYVIKCKKDINNRRYKLQFKNCADEVANALYAGGFKLLNPIESMVTLGLTYSTALGRRIVYTYAIRKCHPFVRMLHSVFELLLRIALFYVVKVVVIYVKDMTLETAVPGIAFVYCVFIFVVTRPE